MAVGAKNPQVLWAVVPPVSVDVINFQGNGAAVPDWPCAASSTPLLDAAGQNRRLQAAARHPAGTGGRHFRQQVTAAAAEEVRFVRLLRVKCEVSIPSERMRRLMCV